MNTIKKNPCPLRNTKDIQPVVFRRATTRPYFIHIRLVHIFVAYCCKNPFSNIHPLIPLSVRWYIFISLIPNLFTCFSHAYPISYILYPISYILYPISYILYFARLNLFYSPQNFGSIVLIFALYFTNVCKLFQKTLGLTDMWM